MNKILYSIMLLAVACFAACSSSEDGDPVSQTPADDVAALYTGHWGSVVTTDLTDTTWYNGSLDIKAKSQYVIGIEGIALNADSTQLFKDTASVNITNTVSGYVFTSSASAVNGFNSVITGGVNGNKATMVFTSSKKVGRKTVGCYYIFKGEKSGAKAE